MKIFVLAVAVLIFVTAFVFWESHYITRTTSVLLKTASKMPSQSIFDKDYAEQDFDTFCLAYAQFRKQWDEVKQVFNLLSGHTETECIEAALEETAVRYLAEDIPGYRSARKKLITELEKLRDREKISFDSIT